MYVSFPGDSGSADPNGARVNSYCTTRCLHGPIYVRSRDRLPLKPGLKLQSAAWTLSVKTGSCCLRSSSRAVLCLRDRQWPERACQLDTQVVFLHSRCQPELFGPLPSRWHGQLLVCACLLVQRARIWLATEPFSILLVTCGDSVPLLQWRATETRATLVPTCCAHNGTREAAKPKGHAERARTIHKDGGYNMGHRSHLLAQGRSSRGCTMAIPPAGQATSARPSRTCTWALLWAITTTWPATI